MVRTVCPCVFIFTLFFFCLTLHGQDEATATGLPPFGSFHGSDFAVVMLQNGNLHMQIRIASFQKRDGQSFDWAYVFDSPHWEGVWTPTPTQQYPRGGNESIRV